MTTINPDVYQDEKISQTLTMLKEGKSKAEIVAHFGNKNWSTIDMYFRRRGFRWNGQTFEEANDPITTAAEDATFIPTKAAQIVRQLGQKFADIRQIATKHGFSSVDDLGVYMKSQGYVWVSDANNYEYDERVIKKEIPSDPLGSTNTENIPKGLESYQSLLDYLLSKQERLHDILDTVNNGTLPRYTFKGAKANKTLGLPTSLQALLSDFSKEFNVTQRDIIEVALAEFFQAYGYEEQLNSVLHVS